MSTNLLVFCGLVALFAVTIGALLFIRYRAEGKASLAFTDILVALVPIVIWVFLGGSVSEFALGPEGLTVKKVVNALRASVDLPIEGSVPYQSDVVTFNAIADYLPTVDLQEEANAGDDSSSGDTTDDGKADAAASPSAKSIKSVAAATAVSEDTAKDETAGVATEKTSEERMNDRLSSVSIVKFTLGTDKISVAQARNLFEDSAWSGGGEDGDGTAELLLTDSSGKFVALCDAVAFNSYNSIDVDTDLPADKYAALEAKQQAAYFDSLMEALKGPEQLDYFLSQDSRRDSCETETVSEKATLSDALQKFNTDDDDLIVVDERGSFLGELDPTAVVNRLVVEIVKSAKASDGT